MTLQPTLIFGFPEGGLETDKKPLMLPDNAFSKLENAYVYRDRVKKREGLTLVGRLRRTLTNSPIVTGAPPGTIDLTVSPQTFNIFTMLGLLATEPNANLERGSLVVTVGAQTLTDVSGNGVLVVAPAGNITAATINYATGVLVITFTAPAAGVVVTITLSYFPGLPVMGIWQREKVGINDEQTVWWDTKYAYIYSGTNFVEFIAGTTWSGSDSDFFSVANYRGPLPSDRLFFATNFVVNAANPIRYTNQSTVAWTDFAPLVSDTDTLYQARIIIPYYGRLVMLNVYEGTTGGGYAGALNIPNRARFSALGDPTEVNAWKTNIRGKGGFIDAPVNQDIISAQFFKNTLIVNFERSTWQLRYVGGYGIPFIWERISSDFGCDSTFSTVIFDQGVLTVGDRAITTSSGNTVIRVDEKIPDQVFDFLNRDNGPQRVCGIRDFKRELVFWCFPDRNDLNSSTDPTKVQYFPNKTLLYNYRNNTFAVFRNNVTFFGLFQLINGVTWDSLDIFWDDMEVTWDDSDEQSKFPRVVSGNQQGYVHYYGYSSLDETSLAISAIDFTVTPIKLTIPNHNLQNEEIIRVEGILVNNPGVSSALNNQIYQVQFIDKDNVTLTKWNGSMYINVAPPAGETTYVGNGEIRLFPQMTIETKDFNPYQPEGKQFRSSFFDFQTDAQPIAAGSAVAVNIVLNGAGSASQEFGNTVIGNKQFENYLTQPYNTLGAYYAWHRFYASCYGQYLRIQLTYDDQLMNELTTHQHAFELNAINMWGRPAGRIVQ